jgi:hypothetical protein
MYGLLEHCVVCGEPLETDESNHHCDPKKLREVNATRRAAELNRGPTEAERIERGFEILAESGDCDE